jgi:hypothetical protein
MNKAVLLVLAAALVAGMTLNTALAIPPFKKEFDEKYVKKDSTDPAEKSLAEAVDKAKCLVCHGKNDQGKQDTKLRNAYGKALDELLDKKADAKDKEKIVKALDTVAAMKSNPSDPGSPTFGDLLKQGKLPATD